MALWKKGCASQKSPYRTNPDEGTEGCPSHTPNTSTTTTKLTVESDVILDRPTAKEDSALTLFLQSHVDGCSRHVPMLRCRRQIWHHILVHQHGGRRKAARDAVRVGLFQHHMRRVRCMGIPAVERGRRWSSPGSKSLQAEGWMPFGPFRYLSRFKL